MESIELILAMLMITAGFSAPVIAVLWVRGGQ